MHTYPMGTADGGFLICAVEDQDRGLVGAGAHPHRAVSKLCPGYKFTGATGGAPTLFFADDAACLASSLADLQLIFDTAWMVSRLIGLTVGVKSSGTKTAWSGTYWEGGHEKKMEGWEIVLPDGRVVPQVNEYKYLGQQELAGWRVPAADGGGDRHSRTIDKVKRQCCRLIRMLGRVPLLGPEQLRRGMSLAVAGTVGYYARATPLPFSVCASIETARAEALRRRGICPGEPRILMFSPYHAGGLQHEHVYQYAAAAFVDEFDWVLSGDRCGCAVKTSSRLTHRTKLLTPRKMCRIFCGTTDGCGVCCI